MITTKVETFNNYINGEWQESVSKKTFFSVNPANTEDVVGEFQASNEQDVKIAIEAAKNAFPSWSQTAPSKRAAILNQAASILEQNVASLGRRVNKGRRQAC